MSSPEAHAFSGVYPILYAFFDDAGRLDRAAMRLQVEHCIAKGCHGIAVLGLVTEVHKMDVTERRHVVELVAELIDGRVPYAVTVAEPSVEGQIAFARAAQAVGADWVILQPPAIRGAGEAAFVRFFGRIADALQVPVAIQNNPVNLDVSLSITSLVQLARAHANVTLLKGEGFSIDIARLIEATEGRLQVFGGHGGIEFLTLLRSGGVGLIPAPECLAAQVRIFELVRAGREPEAEALHRRILPEIVFMSRNLGGMLAYGKRLMAHRLGIGAVIDRAPAAETTPFGMAELERFAAELDQLDVDLAAGAAPPRAQPA